MKKLFQPLSKRLSALALGGAVVLAGSALAFTQKTKSESHNPSINVQVDERPIGREIGGHTSFSPVIKKVAPGVVKVSTSTKVHNMAFSGPQGNGMDDLLRRFFGDESEGRAPRRNFGTPRQQGVGSGVIATKDGYILTNN